MSMIAKSDSKNRTKEHFDKTASDYNNSSDGKFVEPMYDAIVTEIEKSESGKILDVGCGNGNLFKYLGDERYELTGIDFSANMIDEAMRNCSKRASFWSQMLKDCLSMTNRLTLSCAMPHFTTTYIRTWFWAR